MTKIHLEIMTILSDPNFHPGTPEAETNTTVNKNYLRLCHKSATATVTKCTVNSNDGSLYDCQVIINTASYGTTQAWE